MNPKKQKCVTCGYEYEEAKGQFHPPEECPHPSIKKEKPQVKENMTNNTQ